MLRNPKTTVYGYLVLASALCTLLAHALGDHGLSVTDIAHLGEALAGVGLISAGDGSH